MGLSNYMHLRGAPGNFFTDMEEITALAAEVRLRYGGIVVLNNPANQAITVPAAACVPGTWWQFTARDTNNGTTVTLPSGVTWDGTNRIATFDSDGDFLFGYFETATRFRVVINGGSVAFS